jgi:energy-coupling factor transport system permease protein
MNNMVLGQYYNTDSIIHRLDSRTKLISLFLLMAATFLIDDYYMLGLMIAFTVIVVMLTKVPFMKFFRSLKQIAFLLVFSFVFQVIANQSGSLLLTIPQNLSYFNLGLSVAIVIAFYFLRRYLPWRFLWFLGLIVLIIYILKTPILGPGFHSYTLKVYQAGLELAILIILRIFVLIIISTILTLTTKPTDLNNGLEWLLKPFELVGIKTSILAMMISIAMRFIPTLFNETNKILRAQASRGVDFREGNVKEKIIQIVSLLIPMFVMAFKRAEDLADAMEARGYIPGAKRTKLALMKFGFCDYATLFICLVVLSGLVYYKVGLYAL